MESLVIESSSVKPIYIPGVATRNDNVFDYWNESITGAGSIDKAEWAYQSISEQVQLWYSEDPNIEVHVSSISVSRGSGSQRHLANLLDDRGILNSSGDAYLIQPEWVHQDLIFAFESVVKSTNWRATGRYATLGRTDYRLWHTAYTFLIDLDKVEGKHRN